MKAMISGIEIKVDNRLPGMVCEGCDVAMFGVMKKMTFYCMRDDGLIGPMIEVKKGTAYLNGKEFAIIPDECPKGNEPWEIKGLEK